MEQRKTLSMPKKNGFLVLSRTPGRSIIIDGEIKVTVLEIKGHQVKIGIEAPKEMPINRSEIQEKINSAK